MFTAWHVESDGENKKKIDDMGTLIDLGRTLEPHGMKRRDES